MKYTLFFITGISFIISVNVWAAKRDQELFRMYDACSQFTFHPDCSK